MYHPRYYPDPFRLPIIVTTGARIEPLPDPRPHPQPKIPVDKKFLLLMAALILAMPEKWFPSQRGNTRRRPRNPGHLDGLFPVSSNEPLGVIQHCYDWKPVMSKYGYPVWRCAAYSSSCKDGEAVELGPSGGEVRACVEYKKIYSPGYGKEIDRCVRYARVIDKECMITPFPAQKSFRQASKAYIDPKKRRLKNGVRLVSSYEKGVERTAKGMARATRQAEEADEKYLYHEIKSRGGIRPYRKGQLREEYSLIPLHLKNRRGLPLDEMSAEMGIDETELLRRIRDTYPRKKKVKIDWRDYEEDAREAMEQDIEPILSPLLMKESLAGAVKWIPRDLKKGAFAKQAQRAGMETQDFAQYVLDNPQQFQKRTVTRARLAQTFLKMSKGEYSQTAELEGIDPWVVYSVARLAQALGLMGTDV